ncbi:Crp/Fnr family transcriptional regulator [Pinibacter aurantiacus]|uniref:Crp/Fnr family transcriptional regulator n=1 Tax=Pinibacter aurantiacus TaxID=2851599 RepID=A0A9E2W5U4_9BACT|nr:Crp/Fnr family transcriptional regulator [Pinibacter aurantiacus]MBV4359269.1 Crp/Fnr family transcriptional regulator [Pinibacter aurantiacus]
MVSGFETYLQTHTNLSSEEIERASSLAMPRMLQRNELLLQEGQVCRYKTFVVKGLLRTFGTVADGSEHILYFSQEHSWIVDAESYNKQIPSSFNIAAIEKSEVLLWTKTDFDLLLEEVPELMTFSQQLILGSSYNSRQRLFLSLSATPEEKYNDFVQHYPDLLARLPLHMIAAYLGISIKTLTRIRHAQINR